MRNKWQWFALAGVVVVGFAVLVTSQTVIIQRPRNATGLSPGIGYGSRLPVITDDGTPPYDGEPFMVRTEGTSDPTLYIYSTYSGLWTQVPQVRGERPNIIREEFNQPNSISTEEDYTAAVVTDGGENVIWLPTSPLGEIAYRLEAPGGPGLAATPAPFSAGGKLTLDGYTDDADNEGLELVFGQPGPDFLGWSYDETTSLSTYCEASITLADISDVDDLWFGWWVQEAYDNPPASATFDTSAMFVLSDNAGDLDIETQLNGGGLLNDDTGVTWADSGTHVLRVTLNADTVTFTLDGAAVTQTNAVLNLDDGDKAVCGFGYTLDAASDVQATIDYVEIGTIQ